MDKQALPARRQERREDTQKTPEQRRPQDPARVPVQAALTREVLRSEEGLWDLSPSLLQELAALLGNSAMAELLEGDGEGPETFLFIPTAAERAAEDVNRIRTLPPALYPLEPFPHREGPIPPASPARRVRERAGERPAAVSFGMR